jgi:hypothetical protein
VPLAFNERERAALELIRRQRVATASILTAEVCGGSENICKKVLMRLENYVASEPLGPKTKYYRLTAPGAKQLGAPEEIARPLGPQALPKAVGILGFCRGGSVKRERYTRQEFIDDFPELVTELLGRDYHTDFFLDHDGTHARLGQICVDLGGDCKKLVSKCRVKLREYLDVPNIRDIVAEGLFTWAIVVAEEEKAQAIRLLLNQNPLRARVIVESSTELQKCETQWGLTE